MRTHIKRFNICLLATALLCVFTSCTDEPVVVNNYYITNSDGSVSQVNSVPEGYVEVSSNPSSNSASKMNSDSSVAYEFGVDNNLKLKTTYYVTGTKNYLALRTAPYYDGSNEIGKLSNGDTLEVLSQTIYGDKGEYCYVTATSGNSNGKSGYVNRNYISLKSEKTVSSASSSKANKTSSSTSSKKAASSSASKKAETSSKAQTSQKVESVSLAIKNGSDYTTYAVVEGRISSGDVVWDYTTEERPGAQLPCARELGQRNGVYYFADGSTAVALDVQSGSIVWKADMGVSVGASLLANDAIYVCGALQSNLSIIDYDGNTTLKAKTISSEYYWPSDIQVDGDIIAITMTGASTGHKLPKTLYVDKLGNLMEDSSENSGDTEDLGVLLENAYIPIKSNYSSSPLYQYLEFDMNNDGIPELIIDHGNAEQDRTITFFTLKNKKAEVIGDNFSGMHVSYYNDNSTGQLCTVSVFPGSDSIYIDWYQYDGNSVSVSKSDQYPRNPTETPEQTLNNKGSFTSLN